MASNWKRILTSVNLAPMVLAATALLAGCGGGHEESSAKAPATTGTAATAVAPANAAAPAATSSTTPAAVQPVGADRPEDATAAAAEPAPAAPAPASPAPAAPAPDLALAADAGAPAAAPAALAAPVQADAGAAAPAAPAARTQIASDAIKVEPEVLELGEIPTGDAGRGSYTLTNVGDTPRTLLECKTSCGCTSANCEKNKVLMPGESIAVDIKLDGGEVARELAKTVTFLFSEHTPIRVQVKGTSIAFVSVEPANLDPKTHPDGKVVLKSADGTPFTITSMYPPLIEEFSEEAKTEHEVIIDYDAVKEAGYRQRKLLFRLDHPKCAKATVMLAPSVVANMPQPQQQNAPAAPAGSSIEQMDKLLKDGKTDTVIQLIRKDSITVDQVDRSGQNALIKAARWGNAVVIQELLDKSADVESVDKMGRTPLMYACQAKNVEAVKVLVEAGADVNRKDQIGNHSLCWAAGFGDRATVEYLFEHGATIDIEKGMLGFTPVIWAAGFGETDVLEFIIDNGGKIEDADVLQGATPLMHAARTGRTDNVKALLAAGANVKATDKEGSTALLVAASNAGATAEMIEVLVAAGSDLNAKNAQGKSVLELAEARTDLRAQEVVAAVKKALGME